MLCETLCDFLSPKKLVLRGVGALVVSSIIGFLFSRLFWIVIVYRSRTRRSTPSASPYLRSSSAAWQCASPSCGCGS